MWPACYRLTEAELRNRLSLDVTNGPRGPDTLEADRSSLWVTVLIQSKCRPDKNQCLHEYTRGTLKLLLHFFFTRVVVVNDSEDGLQGGAVTIQSLEQTLVDVLQENRALSSLFCDIYNVPQSDATVTSVHPGGLTSALTPLMASSLNHSW